MPPPNRKHPLALAVEWVAKITTVALEMVLPGLAGLWLDERWGAQVLGFPLFGLLGFALGLVVAIWHLLKMVPKPTARRSSKTAPAKLDQAKSDQADLDQGIGDPSGSSSPETSRERRRPTRPGE